MCSMKRRILSFTLGAMVVLAGRILSADLSVGTADTTSRTEHTVKIGSKTVFSVSGQFRKPDSLDLQEYFTDDLPPGAAAFYDPSSSVRLVIHLTELECADSLVIDAVTDVIYGFSTPEFRVLSVTVDTVYVPDRVVVELAETQESFLWYSLSFLICDETGLIIVHLSCELNDKEVCLALGRELFDRIHTDTEDQ